MVNFLRGLIFSGLMLFAFVSGAQLSSGDIAFIGFNQDPGPPADEDDDFTFIALTDIPAGTIIYFTEQGVDVNTMSWFANTEGHFSWTSPVGGLSCGSIVHIYESVASPNTFIASSGTTSGLLSGGSWSLTAGDQVLAYQASSVAASVSSCTFISGIHMEDDLATGETNGWTSLTYVGTGVSYCHLPPGLTNGVNCISLYNSGVPEWDNGKYTGTLTGLASVLRTSINTVSNWSTDDVTPYSIAPANYSPSVTCAAPCSNPSVPVVTASASSVCSGNSTTLLISGSLNDATAWNVYSGSCGGTLLGTTATSGFVVTPSSTTTYFIRGEGGCTSPGSCGTITITVNTLPLVTPASQSNVSCSGGSNGTASVNVSGGSGGYSYNWTPGNPPGDGTASVSGLTAGMWTCTVTDANSCSGLANISITTDADITAPVPNVASLSNVTAQCSVTGLTAPTATDNCAGTITGTHNATLPITSQGTTVVTWTYNDGNGNSTTQTQNVIIDDITAPVADVVTLSDIVTNCGQAVSSLTAPTATDNCAGTVTGTHGLTLPITSSTTVTWTYNDGNGNTSTQTQNVIINADVTAPVADVVTLSDIVTNCGQAVSSLTAPTATDNCAGTVTGTHGLTLPITSSTTITWTYNDGNGNTSTQTQNVIINADVTAPVADVVTLSDIVTNCGQAVSSLTAPTATDNCAGTVTGTHGLTLPITSSTTVTWTYNDGNGNISTQTQNVIINADVTAPVADVVTLADVSASCSVSSLAAPTATDNCAGIITGTHNVTLPVTSSTTVTWTYDDGNGNTSTQTQNVIIDDVTAPVADLTALSDITSECEVTSLSAPTATDNCAGIITGTHNATLPVTSSTTVTWTYDDGNGNIATQTQNVIIDDVTAPVADLTTLSDITSECEVTSLSAPTATDNCAGIITGTHNVTLPVTSSTTVTWTYDDGNGNTSTQTQNVIIDDVTAPVADLTALSDITSECEVTSLSAPTATDNCAGIITGTHNATLPVTSSTTVTWTYDDGNGNTSTQTQNVIIDDVTAPVADLTTLSDITSECEVTSLTSPTATDNCAGTITGTHNATLPVTSSTTVTWTYDDGNGNTSTQIQNVIIDDVTAPVADLTALSDITSECEVTSLSAPTATDNCAGIITGTHNATLPVTSSTTVTWTYDDGNGNIATQTQNIVITSIDNGVTQVDALTLSADASGYAYQWVDCDNGNMPISGETSQTFAAAANGNYAVVIDNGMCSVTSVCTEINSVGLEEKSQGDILTVYPNPTNDIIYIQDADHSLIRVTVTDALGKNVSTGVTENDGIITVVLPEASGIYYLLLETATTQQVEKIIKN